MGYFQRAIREPDNIILETRSILADLFKQVPELADEAEHPLIERTMNCLAYDRRAEDELATFCYELLSDALMSGGEPREIPYLAPRGSDYENRQHHAVERAQTGANEMYRIGQELHALFKGLKLYHNGYLHYHFAGWVGRDMLLTRLIAPVLQTTRPIDHLCDDDLWRPTPMRRSMRR